MKTTVIPKGLQGIDIKKGIAVWEDDWEDYFYVLQLFSKRRRDSAKDICQLLKDGERTQAMELAHAVKGVSGNLYLSPTFERAKDLEMVLRQEDADETAALEAFDEAMTTALSSIDLLLKLNAPAPSESTPIDLNETRILLNKIAVMLRETILDETFTSMLSTAEKTLKPHVGDDVTTLKRQASEFDFKDALKTLETIAGKLNISIEE